MKGECKDLNGSDVYACPFLSRRAGSNYSTRCGNWAFGDRPQPRRLFASRVLAEDWSPLLPHNLLQCLEFLWTVVCATRCSPHRDAALFYGCWQAQHWSERSGAAALAGLLCQDVSHFWLSLILLGLGFYTDCHIVERLTRSEDLWCAVIRGRVPSQNNPGPPAIGAQPALVHRLG